MTRAEIESEARVSAGNIGAWTDLSGREGKASKWRRPRLWPSLLGAGFLLAAVIAIAVAQGPVRLPLHTVWQVLIGHIFGVHTGTVNAGADSIVWRIRLPRVVLAGMVGAALSYSGATYQGVFRNPLADPYLIGVASGAGLGAALAIIFPLHGSWHGVTPVPLFAFGGAMAAVTLSYTIARTGRAVPLMTLILAGVAISALASAAMSFLFMLHNEKFLSIFAWLLGGFNAGNWQSCFLILPYVATSAAIVLAFGRVLNVLQVGDDQAQQLGIPVERVKLLLLLAASLAAAAAVSVSGLIGFVGLIVPHALRLIWGPDYRRLLPLSMVLGAAFLVLADLFARLVIAPQEVPIGIVTAFCGAPFFLFLLKRRQRAVQ
jgi:iron complex transport system permease protein